MSYRAMIIVLFFLSLAHAGMTADQILKQAENYRSLDESYIVMVKVSNRQGNSLLDETEYRIFVKDNSSTLLEQTSPASGRGKKLLMIGSDLWMRTPDIKKAIRISMDQKLTGETANGDLSKTNFYGDYEPQITEENKTQYKLLLTSKKDGTTYQKIYYYISKVGYVPVKAEFLAVSGKILKYMEFSKPDKKIKKHTLITKLKITDGLVKDRSSTLVYTQFKVQKLEDSVFNRASL